jgi:hypothetical protein
MLKSVGAVVAGFVIVVVLSLATDMLLHKTGVFPPWGESMTGYEGALLLATVYRTIYSVLGSYLTARLAPDKPMLHSLAGGIIGLILSIVGVVETWNKGPAFGPHWYPIALVALALPGAWLGGKLRVLQLPARVDA